jgi:hypothetical protein
MKPKSTGESISIAGLDDVVMPGEIAQWLDWGIVAAVMMASAVALSLNVADPDLWGHVQYGRDALRHGLPATTTYSYVAEGYPWINHEILAEYALAIVADLFGGPGLLTLKCLLGVAIIGVIFWRSKRFGSGLMASCSLAMLVAITLGNHWVLRPQIASYVSFALLLALLTYCFEGWEGQWQMPLGWLARWRGESPAALPETEPLTYSSPRMKLLWLAVPLFMLWTNAHGGFLAGLCVFLAYLGLRGAEAFCRNGRKAEGLLRRFGLMGVGAILATFLNPYGPYFHFWLYDDLKVPRPEIIEWRAPSLFELQFLPFWLLLAAAVASFVMTSRSRDFTHLVILALILWQSLTHHRHIAFFAIACGWWLPAHWDSLMVRLGVGQRCKTDEELRYGWAPPESAAYSSGFSPRMQLGLSLALVVTICLSTFQLTNRLTTLKVERDYYPVAAFNFIAKQGLSGKMVCTFNWAQYALAAFGPHEPGRPGILVHVDGRCRTSYSQSMLDTHFDFLIGNVGPEMRYRDPKSGPFDPEKVLNVEHPDLVLISRLQEPSVKVMEQQKGVWLLLYQDSLSQLWGRASRYDDPKSAYYLPPSKREVGESPQRGYTVWPALPPYDPTANATAERDLAVSN